MTGRETFYDSIADEFDELMDSYDLERRLDTVFEILLADERLAGKRVLDAGCGTGAFSLRAREAGAEITALDLGPALLRLTRSKGVEEVVCSSVLDLPFRDATFDFVISSECIEHTPDPRRAVTELTRTLRPGGVLALTCPNRIWLWSCRLANFFKLRPYQGLENWPSWSQLELWLAGSAAVEEHRGLHLFPFVLHGTRPLLRGLDRWSARWGRVFVNQCVRARRFEAHDLNRGE